MHNSNFSYLNPPLAFLLTSIRNRDLRTNAFVAIGLVAVAVGSAIKPYLAKTLEIIKQCLPSKVPLYTNLLLLNIFIFTSAI